MYIYLPTPHTLGESLESFESPFHGSLGQTGTTPTLEAMACRLLCASNLAYAPPTQATAPVPYSISPAKDYYKTGGFINPPKVFTGAGTKGIDACLIGTLQGPAPTQKSVVLAFRGTLPPLEKPLDVSYNLRTAQDWLNDFEGVLVDFKKIPGVKVHKGFHDTVNSFYGQGIVPAIKARLDLHRGAQLYITGHSKGGAMAYVAALLLRTMHPEIPLAGVISFEAPRVGDTSFVAAYNACKIDSLRYEFMNDIVPHLPLSGASAKFFASMPLIQAARNILYPKSARTLTFEHVGELRFIDWDGNVVKDKPGLQDERNVKLYKKLLPLPLPAILSLLYSEHPVGCGTKAWRVICNTECT